MQEMVTPSCSFGYLCDRRGRVCYSDDLGVSSYCVHMPGDAAVRLSMVVEVCTQLVSDFRQMMGFAI